MGSWGGWGGVQRQQAPELLRVPLEAVVLTVKATFGDGAPADDVLCRALTPPKETAVAAAVTALKVPLPSPRSLLRCPPLSFPLGRGPS